MENSLVGEKTIAFSIAQEILETSVKIPTLPANGRKILQVVRQPEEKIDVPAFVKLVESDPGLLTRILQLSNSTFYSGMDKIVSLRAAVTRIGLLETVNTVSLHFFQKMLPKFPDIPGFSYHDFWSRSWVCAVANRRLGHPNLEMDVLPGDLYMAGMLHGLGKLFLAIHFPDQFTNCVQKARELKQPLHRVELDVFGTTDGLVASRVLKIWNLPSLVCEGVGFCQRPEMAPPEYKIISGLTQFACGIAQKMGLGASGDGVKTQLPDTFLGAKSSLKIAQEDIQNALVQEITTSLEKKVDTVVNPPKAGRPVDLKTDKGQPALGGKAANANVQNKKGMLGWVKSFWGSK